MSQRRGHEPKGALEPIEKLKVAYFYHCRGVAQQVLADIFDVNAARVNEAIMAVRKAVELPEDE